MKPARLPRLTRRVRRRLFVLGVVAVVVASLPVWAPRVLSTLPAFRVERIEVLGTRYVAPDEIVRLAAFDTTASVWDDPAIWEARIRALPLVRLAHVHRRGLRALEVRVVEDRPVALAATPSLVPVNAEGRVLPLDPAEVGLDLPLLGGKASLERGRLSDATHLRLAELVGRLEEYDSGFTAKLSEVGVVAGGDIEIRMLQSAHCARILLPAKEPLLGLRRVEAALSAAGGRAAEADARFADQVVLRGVVRSPDLDRRALR